MVYREKPVQFYLLALSIEGYIPSDWIKWLDLFAIRWFRHTPNAPHANPECHTFILASELDLDEVDTIFRGKLDPFKITYTLMEVDPLGIRGNSMAASYIEKEVFGKVQRTVDQPEEIP